MTTRWPLRLLLISISLLPVGCPSNKATTESDSILTLGAYSVPREVYGRAIIPGFKEQWRKDTGSDISIEESYLASGAQARAVAAGFQADVVALSLEPDVQKLVEAKKITKDWKKGQHAGIITRSVVVIGVRPGNPKGIQSWADLTRHGITVLTPNVRTSGGAMWNVLAVYGAVLRGKVAGQEGTSAAATGFLAQVLKNVSIMDRSGRESMLNFERGVGDAIITYENEILIAKTQGKTYDYIVPESTVIIENPVAVVDSYAEPRGRTKAADAFIDYMWSHAAQEAFASFGLRPVVDNISAKNTAHFAPLKDSFTASDLGGWDKVLADVFGPDAAYDRALTLSRTLTKP